MNNWDKYRRMECVQRKSTYNEEVVKLMAQHHDRLKNELVHNPEDNDVLHDAFLKLTYQYNPDGDFISQFRILFKQLKGAYYRDDKANHFYTLKEHILNIPEVEYSKVPDKDVDIITKLKAYALLKQA